MLSIVMTKFCSQNVTTLSKMNFVINFVVADEDTLKTKAAWVFRYKTTTEWLYSSFFSFLYLGNINYCRRKYMRPECYCVHRFFSLLLGVIIFTSCPYFAKKKGSSFSKQDQKTRKKLSKKSVRFVIRHVIINHCNPLSVFA